MLGTVLKAAKEQRQNILTLSAVCVGAAAVGAGGAKAYLYRTYRDINERWGTVENPKFTVRNRDDFAPRTTFASVIARRLERLLEEKEILLEAHARLEEVERALTKRLEGDGTEFNSPGQADPLHLRCCEELTHIEELVSSSAAWRKTDENTLELGDKLSDEEYIKLFGEPEEFARSLFIELTGSAPPPEVRITKNAIHTPHIVGTACEIREQINVPHAEYVDWVSVCLHEYGHLCCRVTSPDLWRSTPYSFEERAREEAGAVLFLDAAGRIMKDPFLQRVFLSSLDHYTLDFYLSTELFTPSELHRYAGAIADSALTLHPNPADAYNAVATGHTMDPAILALVQTTRERMSEGHGIDRFNRELREEIQNRILRLKLEM